MNNRPKKGYGYIYKYTSPSGKSYVGQTIRSLKERSGHNGKNYKGCPLFYKAIKKYGFNSFEVEILAEVKKQLLDKYEKRFIQMFNTLSPYGYNINEGGQKIGKKGKKIYQYSLQDGRLLKQWNSIKEIPKEFGNVYNVLANKSYSQYGYGWSYIKLDRYPVHEKVIINEKKVLQYSLNGELIKEYNSISAAAKETNSSRSAIKRCCRHQLKQHNGFKWECSEILKQKKFNNTAKKILQLDPNTYEVIHVFNSISQAARSLEKGTSLIRRVLNNDKNAYGYKWKTAQGSTTKYS